jgi:uncharacterized iron-regulated membrane protein
MTSYRMRSNVILTAAISVHSSAQFFPEARRGIPRGGLPLKIIWAILDIITIAVLITGLYLWLRRRQSGVSVERVVADASASDHRPAYKS